MNFYLVLLYQVIKQVLLQQIGQIKTEQSYKTSNSDSESKSISLEQKIFSGFKGVNTFKKSELETQKASLQA